MPNTTTAVISAIVLLLILALAVPLRNRIRADQAVQRQKDEEAQRLREEERRQWAAEDALLDEMELAAEEEECEETDEEA